MASHTWIVDTDNRRFLRVIVENKRMDSIQEDDQDLFALTFTVRAGWYDLAANH